ncbi:MAG: hypothetical protein HJJLKODD_02260 [Phycisphaerae bacterium]|nr:hypothetical protein [Phycisphaerae bacterium]
MKYVIILPDGAADFPVPQLSNQTPLQAAGKPNMNWVATHGRLGLVQTVPDGFIPGTDVASLTLFGYEPQRYYTGRAPIEAAARQIPVGPGEMVFRSNFVTILDGRMTDFTADHIHQPEADRLIADLNQLFREQGCQFYSGVSYRNLLVLKDTDHMQVKCQPPHDIPDQPVDDYWPSGAGAERLRDIMQQAAQLLQNHEVNRWRRQQGRIPVTHIWLWGQGRPVSMPTLWERYGLRGAVITAVDIIHGLGAMMGLEYIDVPGITGYLDTNFAGKGQYAVDALDRFDLVVVHVEAPDEAGHRGLAHEKVKALEEIDRHVVGPLREALRSYPEWRMLIAPDHYTPVSTRAHDATPPPYCYCGTDIPASGASGFHEAAAAQQNNYAPKGELLIQEFINKKAQ